MQFDVLTLFPEMFNILNESIIGRAKEKGLINVNLINIRDFSKNKHKKVDDTPYGGGAGMVIQPDVVYDAYKSVKDEKSKVIFLSPQGKKLNQAKVQELSKEEHLILLCGHYEGVDQRVLDEIVDEEISIGDYVLTGGELASQVLMDCVIRLIPGVINSESLIEESHTNYLLEYPQYTKPDLFRGRVVPEILKSGNHKKIAEYRKNESIRITKINRPDLLKKYNDLNNK